MENVPPPPKMNGDDLPTLDQLLRPKRNVKASRQKRSSALNTRTDADHADEGAHAESGLLTPPSSQTQEEDMDPSRMLFSPPPEEVLRNGRNAAARSRSVPVQQLPFTPSLLADPPAQNTALSKRKRNAHNRSSSHNALDVILNSVSANVMSMAEATPNPKPRKQTKHGSPSCQSIDLQDEPTTPTRASSQRPSESPTKCTLYVSPHHANPSADYIPPLPIISRQTVSARRRSTTPVPPYEPPREQFTPPREIIHTPPRATLSPERMSKSSKRKSTAFKNTKKLVLTIKKEPPEIDLSLPPPPPSPSDDPLLLKGLPGHPRRYRPQPEPLSTSTSSSTHSRQTPSIASSSVSPPGGARVTRLPDLNTNIDISMDGFDDDDLDDSLIGAPPIFDFTNAQEDPNVWDDVTSDSGSEEFDQTGEYTGRFKVLTVPTKADPPSSCTRSRQEAWGNHSSPYPGRRRSLPGSSSPPLRAVLDEEGAEQNGNLDDEDVFFLDTSVDADADTTGREEFEEGGSAEVLEEERNAGKFVKTHHELHPPSLTDGRSPSPLPIVDTPEESGAFFATQHHVRFAPPRDSLGDISMEEIEGPSQDDWQSTNSTVQDVHADRLEERPIPKPGHGHDRDYDSDSDSSDEETVDRELSREPDHDTGDEEERDTRPAPPTVPTPPRDHTSVHSTSLSSEQPPRPRGFLSITSPLRRQKSPQVTQSFQAHSTSPMPSIEAVFSTSIPVPVPLPTNGPVMDDVLQASGSRLPEPEVGPEKTSQSAVGHTRMEIEEEDNQATVQVEVAPDVEESSGDESEDLDDGIVKITSGDPRVAARAAAILKMHDYDFIIKDPSRKRRYSSVDSAMRKARRKSVIESGVAKRGVPIQRRRTLGGVIGDKVFIPGSPIITVPQLLQEAEQSVEQREKGIHTPSRAGSHASDSASFRLPRPLDRPMFETPAPRQRAQARPTFNSIGPRSWEKDDWKLLDACFTDERLALGSHKRLGEATLAAVHDIDLENVVNRFSEFTGGVPMDECWPGWTRDDVLRRVRALQKKQRSGNGAPPTPSGRFSSVALSEVPDFTPLPSRQPSVQPALERWGSTSTVHSTLPAVPATLLAPRYSHLLDEAIAISRIEVNSQSSTQPVAYRGASAPITEPRGFSLPPQSPAAVQRSESEVPTTGEDNSMTNLMPPPPIPPRSIASRMKGFFFSYLPRATKPTATKKPAAPAQPGLPIPPPEVFQKPRGPITTPVSKPASKPVHPKELVHLNHAPPPKPSMIPRPAQQKPKRLVDLHPAPLPESRPRSSIGMLSLSDRRSSSGSVKDLVRGFEDMEKKQERERLEEVTRLRRVRSVGEWASAAGPRVQGQRPTWKP